MTREDIKAQLLNKQQELDALLTANNLTVTALAPQQQTILKEAYGVLGLTFIGKKTFIAYVQDWIEDFEIVLANDDDSTIVLVVKDIRRSLRGEIQNTDFPISKLIWNAFDKELKSLGKQTNPQALRHALRKGLSSFSATMNNKSKLSDHFKEKGNKKEYKAISKDDLNEQILSARQFEGWLLGFSNKADVENKTKAKELAQEAKEFDLAYSTWFNEQKMLLSNIVSEDRGTDSTNSMSKAKFVAVLLNENKKWETAQPELGKELSQQILNNLKGDSLSIKDYVNAMNKALNELSTPMPIIAANWYKNRQFPILAGVKTVLTTENEGSSDYDIVEEYIQWFAQVGGVVDSLKLPSNRQFVAEKLGKGFSSTLGTPELQVFLPELKEQVLSYNKKFLSIEETAQLWKTAVGALIRNSDSLVANYNRLKKAGSRPDSLDQVLLGQAGIDTLQAMFKAALRPLPKLAALANGEAIALVLTLNDGTVLTSNIQTKVSREKQIPFALASGLELLVTKGKSAYNFKETALLSQSPIVISKQQVSVDFEYSIQFSKDRGSSEIGGGIGIDTGITTSVEDSETNSTDLTDTKGTVVGGNASSTTGITGKTDFSLFGLFEAGAEVSEEITIGGHKDWTEETSTTTGKSNTTTVGTTTSMNVNSNSNWNATVNHGQDSGHFTIKGSLVSSQIDTNGGTMQLSIELLSIESPNMKGFAIKKSTPEQNKTVRWKK